MCVCVWGEEAVAVVVFASSASLAEAGLARKRGLGKSRRRTQRAQCGCALISRIAPQASCIALLAPLCPLRPTLAVLRVTIFVHDDSAKPCACVPLPLQCACVATTHTTCLPKPINHPSVSSAALPCRAGVAATAAPRLTRPRTCGACVYASRGYPSVHCTSVQQ